MLLLHHWWLNGNIWCCYHCYGCVVCWCCWKACGNSANNMSIERENAKMLLSDKNLLTIVNQIVENKFEFLWLWVRLSIFIQFFTSIFVTFYSHTIRTLFFIFCILLQQQRIFITIVKTNRTKIKRIFFSFDLVCA